uniref:Uncharacterized protein n=1 Tax=viral metagenome TaxID=1070528 RepID=A0A6C0HSG0_9ZZZZ
MSVVFNVPKFKINILKENVIDEIIVFYGYYQKSMEELTVTFNENPHDDVFRITYSNSDILYDSPFIFSDEELDFIQTNLIQVTFCHFLINIDDTIETIKNKLFIVKHETIPFPTNEMYFMTKKEKYETLGLSVQSFEANPYLLTDEKFELRVNNQWITPIENIYVCYFQDVKKFISPEKEGSLNYYYPQLKEENKSESILKLAPLYDKIDMFYNIYQNKTGYINYISPIIGFKKLDFIIKGSNKIPLVSLFNITHCSEKIPIIKYNTTKTSLNIFRFYAEDVTKTNEKIPNISIALYNLFNNAIDKKTSICYFIQGNYFFICQLFENGDIRITIDFKTGVSKEECVQCINDGITEIFHPLITFFSQMKIEKPVMSLEMLDSINFTNLICAISLNTRELKIPFDCIKPIFVIENTTANTISLLFKRIPNFNLQSSIESFIDRNIKRDVPLEDIIVNVMENYNIDRTRASDIVQSFYRQLDVKERIGRKLHLINPGLPITITLDPLRNIIVFEISQIPQMSIITSLFIFIDSMIRIKLPEHTVYPEKLIKKNCSERVDEIDEILDELNVSNVEAIQEVVPAVPEAVSEVVPEAVEVSESPRIEEKTEMEKKEIIKQMFGDFYDEEEEEEEEMHVAEDDVSNIQHGGENIEERRRRLLEDKEYINTLIANPSLHNFFASRIKKYDQNVFNDESSERGYTSDCQSSRKRQPVVLTKNELETIIEEKGEDFLKPTDILEYTSQEGQDLYYICPRYWCLLDNSPMSQEEVDSGQCGNIIDKKGIEKGKYVVEFFHKEVHGSREDYKQTGPGIMTKNGKNTCLPCCFANWKSKRQEVLKGECKQKYRFYGEEEKKIIIRKKEAPKKRDKFVVARDVEKFPLEQYLWSYPPKSIQTFFNDFNEDHEISDIDHTLKNYELCIMRHGIEYSAKKSFLSCLSDIKYFSKGVQIEKTAGSVDQIIELIVSKLTVDIFVTLQNGSLIEAFSDPRQEINLDEFKETQMYRLFHDNMEKFELICSSFKNYIQFIKNDNFVDYTYTWDLVTQPFIFNNGVNLIIFDLEDDTHIKLICPSNHYSGSFYNPEKKSIIILKKGAFFEPLFTFIKRPEIFATPFFDTLGDQLPINIKASFDIISTKLKFCVPIKNDKYDFEHPILLTDLIEKCKALNMKPIQVVSMRGKVIGLLLYKEEMQGFIPCFPSSINNNIEYTLLDLVAWKSYTETIDFLTSMEDEVPCKIYLQIVEDGKIIGFLTIANQFVPIEPIDISESIEIKTSLSYNHYQVDDALMADKEDDERIRYIDNLKKENILENIFCSYLIYLLNFEENQYILKEIINFTSPIILEEVGIPKIIELLKMIPNILFEENFTILMFENTQNCFTQKTPVFFPLFNLITGHNNKEKYYTKLANYIFKYQSVQQQLQNVNIYFIFNPVHLAINKDEIYIMQNLITIDLDFFKKVAYRNLNTKETYDTVEPITVTKFINVDFEKITMKQCIEKTSQIRSEKWSAFFPKSAREVYYESNENCLFEFALSIINKLIPRPINKEDILRILSQGYLAEMTKFVNAYKSDSSVYYSKLINILKMEGKLIEGEDDKVIYHMIYNNYQLSMSDLWILFTHYKIPVAFLLSNDVIFSNETKGVNYVFIVVPTKSSTYKYIIDNGEIQLNVEDFCTKSKERLTNTFFYEYVFQ